MTTEKMTNEEIFKMFDKKTITKKCFTCGKEIEVNRLTMDQWLNNETEEFLCKECREADKRYVAELKKN